jgi:hypothetical protein
MCECYVQYQEQRQLYFSQPVQYGGLTHKKLDFTIGHLQIDDVLMGCTKAQELQEVFLLIR